MRTHTLLLLLAVGCTTTRLDVEDSGRSTDETGEVSDPADKDGDGYTTDDCDDDDETVHPGAPERCDGIDNNCDGILDDVTDWYADADGDGFGAGPAKPSCEPLPQHVQQSGDCNDARRSIHPDAIDHCGDGIDSDCTGDERGTITRWQYTDVDAQIVNYPKPLHTLVDDGVYVHDGAPTILAICEAQLDVQVQVDSGLLVVGEISEGATWRPPPGRPAALVTNGRLQMSGVDLVHASPARDESVISCLDGEFYAVAGAFQGWSTTGTGGGVWLEGCHASLGDIDMTDFTGEAGAMIELAEGGSLYLDESRFADGMADDVVGLRYHPGAIGASMRHTVFQGNSGQAVMQTASADHFSCGATDAAIDAGFLANEAAAIRLHWNEGGGWLKMYLNRCDFGEGDRDNVADIVFADGSLHSRLGEDASVSFYK